MSTKNATQQVKDPISGAQTRASQWLADGNMAAEAGRTVTAERCFHKAQFWLNRAVLITHQVEGDAPDESETLR